MLSDRALELWFARLQCPEPVRNLISHARSAPPSRRVASRRRNVSGRYPSRKMGLTIQFESHTSELAGIYWYEHDSEVLEYYDQPDIHPKLRYTRADGRSVTTFVTPDFLVLHEAGAYLDEWKTEAELVELAANRPELYQKHDGIWRSAPAEEAAQRLGLAYRLWTRANVGVVLDRNLRFLDDYLRAEVDPDPALAGELIEAVTSQPGLTIGELLAAKGREAAADCLYALIAAERLYLPLSEHPIAEPFHAPLYASAELAASLAEARDSAAPLELAPGSRLDWDGRPWEVVNPGAESVSLRDAAGQLVSLRKHDFQAQLRQGHIRAVPEPAPAGRIGAEVAARLRQASPADLEEANRRYQLLATGSGHDVDVPARTIARYRARYREAELRHGLGYVGLLPAPRSGNTVRKREEMVFSVIEDQITDAYRSKDAPSKTFLYGRIVAACQQMGIEAPSYKTVSAALSRHDAHALTRDREGAKAAYGSEEFYWHLDASVRRHGDRPWEITHADHTKLDIELVCSQTGRNLGRPWLSLLVDAYSRRVLAFWVTFDAPSYRSLMILLRGCVGRHGRLPETIVVDGGAEFGSVYFETLLATFEIGKKLRPGSPRFGSVCERLFGATDERFIHNLRGNTKLMRNVRAVTAEVTPSTRAVWDLWSLNQALDEWFFEVYDQLDHPSLGQSPRDTFTARIALTGARPQRWIADDENFRMLTLPSTTKGTATVDPSRGVKVNYVHYWNPRFRDAALRRRSLPVRYDPMDVRHVYVHVDGEWLECQSQELRSLPAISQRELNFATTEIRERRRAVERGRALTARDVALFLKEQKDNEQLLLLRLRDLAQRQILAPSEANELLRWSAERQAATTAHGAANDGASAHPVGDVELPTDGLAMFTAVDVADAQQSLADDAQHPVREGDEDAFFGEYAPVAAAGR